MKLPERNLTLDIRKRFVPEKVVSQGSGHGTEPVRVQGPSGKCS